MQGGDVFGVGPGDPGLLTLNAIAALNAADVTAHFAKGGNASNARTIASKHFKPGVEELSLLYPVTTEIPKEDVTMVAAQANVSEDRAREALVATKGDIAEAIMKLAQ